MSNGQDGRPQACTPEQVLDAIAKHKTSNIAKLAEALKCSTKTISRRLGEIEPAAIEAALAQVATKLKPTEFEFDTFAEISSVKTWHNNLRYVRQNTVSFCSKRLHMLFRICCHLGAHPDALTVEMGQNVLIAIRQGKANFGEHDFRCTLRSWLMYKGVGGQLLTVSGLDSTTKESEDRSLKKFSIQQRRSIMAKIREKTELGDWHDTKIPSYCLPFKSQPYTAQSMLFLPEWSFYTGTRIGLDKEDGELEKGEYKTGSLNLDWLDVQGLDEIETAPIVYVTVRDKCNIVWHKQLIGEVKEHFVQLWLQAGKPASGRIFPFDYTAVRLFWAMCYLDAGIPESTFKGMTCHMWRHTAAQEFLWATHHLMYELVAATLGWENTEIMKKHYGAMPDSERELGLRQAMGLPVNIEPRVFRFI